jgi:hypothetical protein
MVKVTLYLDDAEWLAFRKDCLDHKTSASREVAQLIRLRRAQWDTEKETPHGSR